MTAFKAKVKAVYPDATCEWVPRTEWRIYWADCCLGYGKTAFAAWVDAWRQIEKGRCGK